MILVDRDISMPDMLTVKFNYYQDYIDRIRMVPTSKFDSENKQWLVSKYHIVELETMFSGEIVYKTPRWVIFGEKEPIIPIMSTRETFVQIPATRYRLFDYQIGGVKFVIDRILNYKFAVCADDVGLGKTPIAITSMRYLMNHASVCKVLVICKKSLRLQWSREIDKFDGNMNHIVVDGTKKKRENSYTRFNNLTNGVLIVNYHTVMNDVDELVKKKFDMVVIDEAHKISSRTGVMNAAAKKVCKAVPYTLFLTGTPIMSSPEDLYGIIQIANSKYLGKWEDFKNRYLTYDPKSMFNKPVGFKNLQELSNKVKEVIIRRTEYDVFVQLPSTVTSSILVETDEIQQKLMDKIKTDTEELMRAYESEKDPVEKVKLSDLVKGVGACRQAVANDPRLFLMSKSKFIVKQYGDLIPGKYTSSPKTEALMDLLQDIIDAGHKAIVFSKFERCVRMLKGDIERELKVKAVCYSGKVDDDTRDQNIKAFWNNDDVKVFVANDAAAEGLNLQCCNHIINYDQPDTPGIKVQRAGRARRIGSIHSTVFVHDLITIGTKDEEKLLELERKKELSHELIGNANEKG